MSATDMKVKPTKAQRKAVGPSRPLPTGRKLSTRLREQEAKI